ncbi:MAG: hypothetical protein AB1531_12480 [Chloroflexota bacterium]
MGRSGARPGYQRPHPVRGRWNI